MPRILDNLSPDATLLAALRATLDLSHRADFCVGYNYDIKIQGWGKSVEQLARDLQTEFPRVQGYSAQNLWYMRQFFWSIMRTQDSNCWLEKSVGPRI